MTNFHFQVPIVFCMVTANIRWIRICVSKHEQKEQVSKWRLAKNGALTKRTCLDSFMYSAMCIVQQHNYTNIKFCLFLGKLSDIL